MEKVKVMIMSTIMGMDKGMDMDTGKIMVTVMIINQNPMLIEKYLVSSINPCESSLTRFICLALNIYFN